MQDSPALLKQAAQEYVQARNAAVAHTSAGRAQIAPMAAPTDLDPCLGQYGGVTIKELRTGGIVYPPGVYLPPSLVLGWKIPNRHALQGAGRVRFYKEPPEPEALKQVLDQEADLIDQLLA